MDEDLKTTQKFFSEIFFKAQELKEGHLDAGIYAELLDSEQRYGEKVFFAQGGMKKIYKVQDYQTDRIVAMACLDEGKDLISKESFLREARITAQLQHPNIISIHDIGIDADQPYFTMKFLEGQTLEETLIADDYSQQNKSYTLTELLEIFKKVCNAVAYAHSKAVIHLDLKPANIHLSDYGEVTVCDWGLAKVLDHDLQQSTLDNYSLSYFDLHNQTLDGYIKGTMGYMSPEQLGNSVKKDQRSDIYSLGAILYKLLTRRQIIHAKSTEEYRDLVLAGKIERPSLYKEDVPNSLEAVCMKCLDLDVENRYQSVDELIAELNAYLRGFATHAEKASLLKQSQLFYKRNRNMCLLALASVLMIISTLSYYLWNLDKAYAQLQQEQIAKEAFAKEAAMKSYEQARLAYTDGNVVSALLSLESAQLLYPELGKHERFHYEILLAMGKFEELEGFEKQDLFDGWLEAQKIYDLNFFREVMGRIKALDSRSLYLAAQKNIYKEHLKSFEEQGAYVAMLLEIDNPHVGEVKAIYNGTLFDLSGCGELRNFDALAAVEIKHLDISHSKIRRMRFMPPNKIEYFDLSYSEALDFPAWKNVQLKVLDASYSAIPRFQKLARPDGYSVEELHVRGNPGNIRLFKDNDNIKKVYVTAKVVLRNGKQNNYIITEQTQEEADRELKLILLTGFDKTRDADITEDEFPFSQDLFKVWDTDKNGLLQSWEFLPIVYIQDNRESLTELSQQFLVRVNASGKLPRLRNGRAGRGRRR